MVLRHDGLTGLTCKKSGWRLQTQLDNSDAELRLNRPHNAGLGPSFPNVCIWKACFESTTKNRLITVQDEDLIDKVKKTKFGKASSLSTSWTLRVFSTNTSHSVWSILNANPSLSGNPVSANLASDSAVWRLFVEECYCFGNPPVLQSDSDSKLQLRSTGTQRLPDHCENLRLF
jgi:hypothetical protein